MHHSMSDCPQCITACQIAHNASLPVCVRRKHIPTAQHLDLFRCSRPTPTLPNNLPDKDCFSDYVRSLGINRDSHIIVYDRGTFFPATRAWWLFRVGWRSMRTYITCAVVLYINCKVYFITYICSR